MNIKELLTQLIAFPSITPKDEGTQDFMIAFLEQLGFRCQRMNQDPVSNFYASYGNTGPLLVFAGHTDVVPIGDLTHWHSDPFTLEEREGLLYGRGVADMKGSLACMLLMAARFVKKYPSFPGQLGFLITSGEEGDEFHLGTPYVMEQLKRLGIQINYCVVGEPSSTVQVGDVIKVGRRGSLSAKIILQGKQGHVAYPHLAQNPIHKISPVLLELSSTQWDEGNAFFPPTSMQITSIHSGGLAGNIIPGELCLDLNFRYSTEQTDELLKEKVNAIFKQQNLTPNIEWRLNGEPFLTEKGALLDACKEAVFASTGVVAELSTSGGTSDGRFIAPFGVEVVELGPVNASIHQVNECLSVKGLETLEQIYFSVAEQLLVKSSATPSS